MEYLKWGFFYTLIWHISLCNKPKVVIQPLPVSIHDCFVPWRFSCQSWSLRYQLIHLSLDSYISQQLTIAFISPLIAQNRSNQFSVQDFNNDFMLNIARTRGLSVWSHFRVDLKCIYSQFFFVSIQVLSCPVDLIREASAQIWWKQLYFNVTGIRFAEERILKWAWTWHV